MDESTRADAAQPPPWYANGLRFQCTGCGDCCTGAPGYVWVNKAEIEGLADASGLPVEQFHRRYVRAVGIRKSLKERPNGECVLFDASTRKCSVYAARPRQCRTWPFWDSNLQNPETWAETCRECPGSGVGKLYTLQQIREQQQQLRL